MQITPIRILVAVGLSCAAGARNAADESAARLACQLRDKRGAGEAIAAGFAHAAGEEAILAALARGADRAVLIGLDGATDPRAASLRLAALAKREKPDLILFGDVAIEDPASQIAPRVAAILGWPCATAVSSLEIADTAVTVDTDTDGIVEKLELALPAVVSVNSDIAAPALLSLYEIVAARSKPIKQVKSASLGTAGPAGFTILRTEPAQIERKRRMVASVDDLITVLREEAHAL